MDRLPERYPQIIAMYAKGRVNALDLFKADFGHYPPNGLEIVDFPDFEVKFKSVFQTKEGLGLLIPTIPSIFTSYILGSTLGPIYLAAATALRTMSLLGFVYSDQDPTIYLNDAYRALTFFQGGRKILSHTISHEFKHVMQGRDDMLSLSSALDERLNIEKKLPEDKREKLSYFADEAEMQARMHTVLVGAYHQFDVMPTTREELFAVLHSQKIKLPESILEELKSTPDGRNALEKFKRNDAFYNRYADKLAVSDLNNVGEALEEEQVAKYWKEDIPFLYGDLLELYGDRYGHKRMGHTHNIQLRELFYRSARDYEMGIVPKPKLDENKNAPKLSVAECRQQNLNQALHSIDSMAPDDATDLGCMILRGDMYQEFGQAVRVAKTDAPFATHALQQIWARQDLTQSQRNELLVAKATPKNYSWRVISSSYEDAVMDRKIVALGQPPHGRDNNVRDITAYRIAS